MASCRFNLSSVESTTLRIQGDFAEFIQYTKGGAFPSVLQVPVPKESPFC